MTIYSCGISSTTSDPAMANSKHLAGKIFTLYPRISVVHVNGGAARNFATSNCVLITYQAHLRCGHETQSSSRARRRPRIDGQAAGNVVSGPPEPQFPAASSRKVSLVRNQELCCLPVEGMEGWDFERAPVVALCPPDTVPSRAPPRTDRQGGYRQVSSAKRRATTIVPVARRLYPERGTRLLIWLAPDGGSQSCSDDLPDGSGMGGFGEAFDIRHP